jgi:hypothetical protein
MAVSRQRVLIVKVAKEIALESARAARAVTFSRAGQGRRLDVFSRLIYKPAHSRQVF